jgi:DNA-binding FadR family transcriptional regulator
MWSAIGAVADGQKVGTTWGEELRAAGNKSHRHLLDALRDSNADRAEWVMSAHVRAFHTAMAETHPQVMTAAIRTLPARRGRFSE